LLRLPYDWISYGTVPVLSQLQWCSAMATHHISHNKGGSDLKIAFTALLGGLLWIVAVGTIAHFLALEPAEPGAPAHEAAEH
jgi:hypothetical protein